jgi:hypothetical protein
MDNQNLPPGAFVTDEVAQEAAPVAEPVAEPADDDLYAAATHDAANGLMIISSPGGQGVREITAAQWPRYAGSEREWVIKQSNYVGAHHSDNVF